MLEYDKVFAAIKRNVLTIVPDVDPGAIVPERTLAELGCNSIDRADIVSMTMADLAVTVPVHEFRQGQPIGSLVETLRGNR